MQDFNTSQPWKPQPFSERKSQNLGFGDYSKRVLFHLFVGGASGSAIGWGIDKLRNNSHINGGFSSFKYWGGLLGVMVGGYFNWRLTEAAQLQTNQVLQDYKQLPGVVVSNDELKADNALLKRMITHQEEQLKQVPQATIHAATSDHSGAIHRSPIEHQK